MYEGQLTRHVQIIKGEFGGKPETSEICIGAAYVRVWEVEGVG